MQEKSVDHVGGEAAARGAVLKRVYKRITIGVFCADCASVIAVDLERRDLKPEIKVELLEQDAPDNCARCAKPIRYIEIV